MDTLTGNTIIFTDLHCGLSGNKLSKLKICINACKSIIETANNNNVKNIIFAGDWFHSRSLLDTNTINISLKLVQALAKDRNLYLICGNHDSYFKNTTDINSINIFKEYNNVKIIDKTEEIQLNNQRVLLVPWLGEIQNYRPCEFDILIGHFDISSKYLIKSYIEEHSSELKTDIKNIAELNKDYLINHTTNNNSNDFVGNFVDLAKINGTVYAGHIHQHKEFISKKRNFVFIGSPYQQNLGEIDGLNGFYLLDSNNVHKFIETTDVPKHIQLLVSNIKTFDFSSLNGNIVQKIYDIDISHDEDIEISKRITDANPYEELLPEYRVNIKNNDNLPNSKTAELIKKSKLEYLRNYVDEMNQKDLETKELDKEKLFEVLKKYYNTVAGI